MHAVYMCRIILAIFQAQPPGKKHDQSQGRGGKKKKQGHGKPGAKKGRRNPAEEDDDDELLLDLAIAKAQVGKLSAQPHLLL